MHLLFSDVILSESAPDCRPGAVSVPLVEYRGAR
jgi:hypothetical protein